MRSSIGVAAVVLSLALVGAARADASRDALAKISELASAPAGWDREHDTDAKKASFARELVRSFPWASAYEDAKHQRDLFALRDVLRGARSETLAWIWVELLGHAHPYVRLHAVMGLGAIGGRAHLARIEGALADPDPRVRGRAADALAALQGRDAGPAITRLLNDPAVELRKRAAELLDRVDALAAIDALRDAARNETDAATRRAFEGVIASLASAQGERRSVALVASATGANSRVREPRYERVETAERWAALLREHAGPAPAAVNFERQLVLAVFQGEGVNSRGVAAVSVTEDDRVVRLRFDDASYQTGARADRVTPFGFFVIPRASGKKVVFEENVQGIVGEPPVWKVRAER